MDIKKFLDGFGRDVLLLLMFGVIMIYLNGYDAVVSLKPAISFEDMLDGTEVKAGSHVAGNVAYALDYFASESTYTRYRDGSRSTDRKSGNYYLIPTSTGFIGLKSRQVDVSALNKLSDETFEFLTSGTVPTTEIYMQGTVKVMEDELAKYYCEYLEDMGYTESEIEEMGQPLVIQYISFGAVRVMFLSGIVLILLAFLIMWRRYKRALIGSGLKKAEDLPKYPEM